MVSIKCKCGHIDGARFFEPGPTAGRKAVWQCPKCKAEITREDIGGCFALCAASVRAIVLDVDSPGGTVDGAMDWCASLATNR